MKSTSTSFFVAPLAFRHDSASKECRKLQKKKYRFKNYKWFMKKEKVVLHQIDLSNFNKKTQ